MNNLDQWLRKQATDLDRLIAASCDRAFADHPEWSDFELDQSLEELWQLSKGGDCCYDRPSIGPTYSIWYHARRTHDMIRLVRPWFDAPQEDQWSIIDLGSGTGATIWALGLIAVGMHRCGAKSVPCIEVICVDSSPFMIEHAKRLWTSHFLSLYPEALQFVSVEFVCDTWTHVSTACRARPRIVAGYLFDHSDADRVPEIARSLVAVADRHSAGQAILVGASSKAQLLTLASGEFKHPRWTRNLLTRLEPPLWRGKLAESWRVRKQIYESRLKLDRLRWAAPPAWIDQADCMAAKLSSTVPFQYKLGPTESPPLILDSDQSAAAAPSERSSVIVGAAGSGKSVVLAERITRTLTERPVSESIRILVTTFNKCMVDQLAEWVQSRLPAGWRCTHREQGRWKFEQGLTDGGGKLILMNWDRVPITMFHVNYFRVELGDELNARILDVIRSVRETRHLSSSDYADLLVPEFITAEKRRVWFGLGALTRDAYLETERVGRERPLQRKQRDVVANVITHLPKMLIDQRIEALRRIRGLSGDYAERPIQTFSHVFVDECQDFTPADFELVFALNGGGDRVVVTGDLTQSMWLGPSHRVPPLPSGKRWTRHSLKGSYRLPLRVCECIRPLAESVRARHKPSLEEGVELPESRKGAVLGVRPILVHAESVSERAKQLEQLYAVYGATQGLSSITIAEKDRSLENELRRLIRAMRSKPSIKCESMNRIKGLERPFVVWSTCIPIDADESLQEWAFTVLSRTTSILVISVGPDTLPEFTKIIRCLRQDRLLPWTKAAANWLGEPCSYA